MAVQMELSRILIREASDCQIIELREMDGARTFPILIGLPEAQAIERRLQGIPIKRPLTHELLWNVIEEMGGELVSVTINDLADQTFFALLQIRMKDGEMIEIDSRPSDAIALGIGRGLPIYVEDHVLNEAQSEI